MQLVQQVQVDIRNKDHLRIGRRFGSPSVRRKSEVARGEDPGTCVLNVHVMHFGQVAHTAGDHYEAFVFNGAGVGTDLYARIGVLRIREERYEKNLHSFGGHNAREFRKLYVVADQYADFRAIRLECANRLAAAQSPTFHLVGRDV